MLTKRECLEVKKICRISDITATDIVECVECYRDAIDDNDYHKARIIKYVLYTILKQNANDTDIVARTKKAIESVKTIETLFSNERLNKGDVD